MLNFFLNTLNVKRVNDMDNEKLEQAEEHLEDLEFNGDQNLHEAVCFILRNMIDDENEKEIIDET